MSYNTDKDLRRLFTTFPRRDDGSEIVLPHHFPDSIQPVVDLQEASARLNGLTVEVVQALANSPASESGNIVIPNEERWLIWRVAGGHSNSVSRWVQMFLSQDSVFIPVNTGHNLPSNISDVAFGPLVGQPGSELKTILDAALAAGSVFCRAVITRFALDETLPQTQTIF